MKLYKGYAGSIEFDDEDMVFHGRVLGIRDIVTFEAANADDLVKAFQESVDDYLAFCKEGGMESQRPYSGKLALRTTPEIHALLGKAAASDGKSINQWVSDTLAEAARKRVDESSTKVRTRAH
ncbi:type II toxin-antitoxin system HicB family antitoxin [Mesorhizobium cantuariense]|uniref:Type II toxin-antitoxin system HicB family antitoxin n=1 Tax=Mesorhizobium cantuariense TaxID=1300275 RepID=A0ABV7MKK6_9HYPH